MRIAIPRETAPREARVALIPETVGKLTKSGFEVQVETGAGDRAGFPDTAYRDAGANVMADFAATVAGAAVVVKVREPGPHPTLGKHEADLLPEGSILLGFLGRGESDDLLQKYLARKLSTFSMNAVPRISRAQKMDALSSMAGVAGYKAVLLAATHLGKFFPLLMTAAGTVPPARVFVLGAGVAGLQAIATSRRLGAVVEAFDVRPAVKEEVQSLGGTFVGLATLGESGVGEGGYAKELSRDQHQMELDLIQSRLGNTDVVISTAAIPGRRAPILLTKSMVEVMKPGSVIVDLAAETGGNCELTKPGETVVHNSVVIVGPLDIASTLATHASQMYSRNVVALLLHLSKDGKPNLDFNDEITRGSCLTHGGRRASELQLAEVKS